MKKAILNDVNERIAELEKQHPLLTPDDLYKEIGTPDEIAQGFEGRLEIGNIKKNARKLPRGKLLCLVFLILMILSIIIATIIVKSNESYYSETIYNTSYIWKAD